MSGTQPRFVTAFLIFSPLTLLTGFALAESVPGKTTHWNADLLAPVAAAAMAPLIATIGLRFIAPGFDRLLVAIAGVLTALGMAALLLLGATGGPDTAFYEALASRHGFFIAAGFLALIGGGAAAKWIDRIAQYPFTLLALALGLTAITVLIGETTNGARLWLRLGPLRFQPSEIARLLLAAFVAAYLYERRHLIASSWRLRSVELPPAPYLLPLAAAVLASVGALVLQNDLGMAALVVLGAFASLLGIQQSRSAIGVAALLLGVAATVSYVAVPRVRDRVAGWVDPWRDPAGRGFQFVQADYGLAAGGMAGQPTVGPVAAVPEVHTDLILVAIGGELGLLGAMAVVSLAAMLVCRCVLIGVRTRDGFRALLAVSMAALIAIQTILIVGGSLRVLPLTGLTLPLVSYGGTSMVATLFALGVVGGGEARERVPVSGRGEAGKRPN